MFYDNEVKFYSFIFAIFLILSSSVASAVKIRFPEEELASESVLPLFDPVRTVLNRNIHLSKRFEIGSSASFGLGEPFYYPIHITGQISFYLSEIHGLGISGTYFFPFRSNTGNALNEGRGLDEGKTFNVLALPYPQMMGFLNYQYVPYYGKISLTKKGVLNLSIYGFAGPGFMIFSDGTKQIAGTIGIGQKLYFNKWLAIRGDIGFYGYYGPVPSKTDLNNVSNGSILYQQLKPENKGIILNLIASVGVVFLI